MCRQESIEVKFKSVLGYYSGKKKIKTRVKGDLAEKVKEFVVQNICDSCHQSNECRPEAEVCIPLSRIYRFLGRQEVQICGRKAGKDENCRLIESSTSVPLRNMNRTQVADPHPNIGDRKLKI